MDRVCKLDDLIDEGDAADVSGWDFGWLDGRAAEQRPPWGYSQLLATRLSEVGSALDIDTGGGEMVAGMPRLPSGMEFFDIGAIVHILRKCVWWVPDFTVERYRDVLRQLDGHIRMHGAPVAHSTRTLFEATVIKESDGPAV
jgi:hypothetical protein